MARRNVHQGIGRFGPHVLCSEIRHLHHLPSPLSPLPSPVLFCCCCCYPSYCPSRGVVAVHTNTYYLGRYLGIRIYATTASPRRRFSALDADWFVHGRGSMPPPSPFPLKTKTKDEEITRLGKYLHEQQRQPTMTGCLRYCVGGSCMHGQTGRVLDVRT
ncbi:hypothetical protein LZ30DRAFT_225164 [Colletotrichum cereale]|nr:hypothetical protein LZ30DRAFT_225164 [Colletotrichum cereale]